MENLQIPLLFPFHLAFVVRPDLLPNTLANRAIPLLNILALVSLDQGLEPETITSTFFFADVVRCLTERPRCTWTKHNISGWCGPCALDNGWKKNYTRTKMNFVGPQSGPSGPLQVLGTT